MQSAKPAEVHGINRNILECKSGKRANADDTAVCINRNILECKLSLRSTVSRPRQRINRNILECKFLRSDRL